MKRYVGILLTLVALPLVAAAVSVALADPETGSDGAEIGSVMLLAGMTFGAFLTDAAVLHRVFRVERNVGLVMLGVTAVLVTVALRFVVPTHVGRFDLSALFTGFLLLVVPGFILGEVAFLALAREDRRPPGSRSVRSNGPR